MRLALCGPCCSGKTEIAKATGLYQAKFAQPLYQINKILHQGKNRGYMQEGSDLAKKYFGRKIFLDIFKANYGDYNNVVCDDARYQMELEYLIEAGWRSVYVMANSDIRKARSDALGLEWMPNHSSEKETHLMSHRCQYMIHNEGSLEELKHKAKKLLEPNLKKGVVE